MIIIKTKFSVIYLHELFWILKCTEYLLEKIKVNNSWWPHIISPFVFIKEHLLIDYFDNKSSKLSVIFKPWEHSHRINSNRAGRRGLLVILTSHGSHRSGSWAARLRATLTVLVLKTTKKYESLLFVTINIVLFRYFVGVTRNYNTKDEIAETG